MKRMTSVLLMLMLLGVLIESSQAIECYVDKEVKQCPANFDACLKAVYKVGGETITAKTCALKSTHAWDGCKKAEYGGVVDAQVCICKSDKCNKATMTSSFSHVIIAVALITSVLSAYLM